MCGILGYVSRQAQHSELAQGLAAIKHRGPDSDGLFCGTTADGFNVGFGHARLSIIDLSPAGHQPMLSEDESIVMIFNGEIYNQRELRNELQGIKFKGNSDSEVLLEYYRKFGVKCFNNLRGIFAAAFYHTNTGKVVLLRDHLGIKPLYFSRNSDTIAFASEIRGLRPFLNIPPQVNILDLFEFLNSGFVSEPNTGFDNISKVPPGHFLSYEKGKIDITSYYDIDSETKIPPKNRTSIDEAIDIQLVSDVKIGVFFSGGLDSSVLCTGSLKEALFLRYSEQEISRAKAVDDFPFASKIAHALGINLHVIESSNLNKENNDILEEIRRVVIGTEELISDFTYYSSEILARAAAHQEYKVMLSGMGGDESFIGYPRYKLLLNYRRYYYAFQMIHHLKLENFALRIFNKSKLLERFFEFFKESNFPLAYQKLIGYLSESDIQSLWLNERSIYSDVRNQLASKYSQQLRMFKNESMLFQALVLDYYGFLSHNLTVADKSSMANGLEVRVPLLDINLYNYNMSSARSNNVKFGKITLAKKLLNFLPKKLIYRKKSAFNPPLDHLIDKLGCSTCINVLSTSSLSQFINTEHCKTIVYEHFSGKKNNTYKIWQLLYLSFWIDNMTAPPDHTRAR